MIAQALAALFPAGAVVEVRALADRFTHSGYFDDMAKLADAAAALDADPEVKGIYVTLNEVNPALLARRANRVKMRLSRSDPTTSDADIVRRRWLPIDLDPVRPSGVSSTDAEHEAALRKADEIALWLSEQGFPAPIRADSGNGAHLLYRIDLANDAAATALVKGVFATLDALFSDEKVTVDTANFNASRIWKLYGTCSRKGDHTSERPHRRAKILTAPETVPGECLKSVAGLLPVEAPTPTSKGIDLGKWLAEHGIAVRSTQPWQGGTLFVLYDCPFSDAHHDGAFAIRFASGAIHASCHHASCGGGVQRWPELRAMHEPKKQKRREEVQPLLSSGTVDIMERFAFRVRDVRPPDDALIPVAPLPRRWVAFLAPDDCVECRVLFEVLLGQGDDRTLSGIRSFHDVEHRLFSRTLVSVDDEGVGEHETKDDGSDAGKAACEDEPHRLEPAP